MVSIDTLENLKERLRTERPVLWDQFPDIDLYMDQVLSYMPRQQVASNADDLLTSSMINNYIKEGVLAHANGKKYTRDHLACLTAISHLKRVLSVKDTGLLLKLATEQKNIEHFYEAYGNLLETAFSDVLEHMPDTEEHRMLAEAALRFAVTSYANQIACQRLLDLMREDPTPIKKKAKKKEDDGE